MGAPLASVGVYCTLTGDTLSRRSMEKEVFRRRERAEPPEFRRLPNLGVAGGAGVVGAAATAAAVSLSPVLGYNERVRFVWCKFA